MRLPLLLPGQLLLLSLPLLALSAHPAAAASAPKHILFFLIDDLGFGDAGYKAATYPEVKGMSQIPTPAIDALAMAGVRLESYYVNQLCSPTRTSLLSGRYAYNIGMNAEVIVNGNPSVMPLNLSTVADHLSEAGWATAAFGKWDAGMTAWGATPTCRGFDHFAGFYNAFNDYNTHMVGKGLDLRLDTEPDRNETGRYMTELITARVSSWIQSAVSRSPATRTFAYVAHEAVHGPVEVPLPYIYNTDCHKIIPADQPTRLSLCGSECLMMMMMK